MINVKLWMAYSKLATLCMQQYVFVVVGKLQMLMGPAVALPRCGWFASASEQGRVCSYVDTAAPTKFCLETPFIFFLNCKVITICPMCAV